MPPTPCGLSGADGTLLFCHILSSYVSNCLRVFLYRQSGAKNLDAMFGKAQCQMLQHNYGMALDLMNQAVVMVSNFLPAVIEKMKLQLAMHDWEQVVDTAQRSKDTTLLFPVFRCSVVSLKW